MNALELLKALLQMPELSTVGSAQERAAFIAIRIDGRTVREAGQTIGISKSHVTNLADLFQAKLAKRVTDLRRKQGAGCSAEYRTLYQALYGQLSELRDESGSDDWYDGHKVGDWESDKLRREDLAECFGGASPRFDDE